MMAALHVFPNLFARRASIGRSADFYFYARARNITRITAFINELISGMCEGCFVVTKVVAGRDKCLVECLKILVYN